MLANPIFAEALNQRLRGTGWTAELLGNFLYNGPPEDRPARMPPYDWRNVYNTTSETLKLLSKFLGVCNTRFFFLLLNVKCSTSTSLRHQKESAAMEEIWYGKKRGKKISVTFRVFFPSKLHSERFAEHFLFCLSFFFLCFIWFLSDLTTVIFFGSSCFSEQVLGPLNLQINLFFW